MSSREAEVVTLLSADATLTAILAGGVYGFAASGLEGIRRGGDSPTNAAFDSNGYLKPCVLVRQRDNVPDGIVSDDEEPLDSTVQVVELYFYQDRGYDAIDAAIVRARVVLRKAQASAFANSFPPQLAHIVDRFPDNAALNGASGARMDFAFYGLLGA